MRLNPIACSLIAAITLTAGAAGAQEKVIYSFQNPDDASTPKGSLVFDASGNLYGTSYYGYYGDINDATSGTVFELSPPSVPGGKWTEQVLWSAASNQLRNPIGNVIFGASGNLYGSATGVFELSPPSTAGGTWTETTLTSNEDSLGGLVFDSQGNLYGTSEYLFELSPPSSAGGNWTDQDLFTFDTESTGMAAVGDLIFDSKGNVYGVASQGGAYDSGMVFELSPASGGTWTEKVIWSFGGQGDGVTPLAGLIFDSKDNLYGTCSGGGSSGLGTVFELSPPAKAGGNWTETILHGFAFDSTTEGGQPASGVVFDAQGNLYGTTEQGGPYTAGGIEPFGGGSLYELSPPSQAGGNWTEHILHFFGDTGDGYDPSGGVILDSRGNLYGTTQAGGASGLGTVYEYTSQPTAATPTFSPDPGSYSSVQKVEISDSTPGATIYYTTNGMTPTTSSTKYTSAIEVSSTETIEAIAVASGYSPSEVATAVYTITLRQAATPVFAPKPGKYGVPQKVTITDATPGAIIYYTTNGLPPTTSSSVYKTEIPVTKNETILAIAEASGYATSQQAIGSYTIQVAKPVIFPDGGTYGKEQAVIITDPMPGVTILYTTNGKTPVPGSPRYVGPFKVIESETVQAIAMAIGYGNSPVAKAKFTIEEATATPVFSVKSGTYAKAQTVKITDATAGATIYYTTNGGTPSKTSTKYSGAITVSENKTIKAIAIAKSHANSAIAEAVYSVESTPPTITPEGGTFTRSQSVTLQDSATGALMYYTTNGDTPTKTSTKYSQPFTVSATETVKAIAIAPGHASSAVVPAEFTIK